MSMVGNHLTAKDVVLTLSASTQISAEQKLDDIVDMGQIISFQGNAIVEALASTLSSKEINPKLLGALQRRIEEVTKQIYSDRLVLDFNHKAALLRYLIDALFLAWPRDLLTQFKSNESDSDQVLKYFDPDREVTLLDEPNADSLVIARFLRDHPDCFASFVTFSSVNGYQWRRLTWEKLGRFGLPASALEPFCRAVTSAYEKGITHYDFLFPILLIRIQKDHPGFVLEGKVPASCLEDMKDEIYTNMHF